jgi:4-hydroxyacetophenone monooxygenase
MDLADALEDANLAVLLSALAHLTGDVSWIERDDTDAFFRLRNPGRLDDATATEIRARAAAILSGPRPPTTPRSPEFLVRIAAFCAGEPVDPEYGALIAAESDFGATDPRRFAWPDASSAHHGASFRVAIIGAGLGGVGMGIRLGQAGIPYTIYEKNSGLGGTWWENDYPDLRVDVPNLFYSYSFAPNSDWPHHYSRRNDLQSYVERTANAYGVTEHVEFETEVVSAEYDPTTARWTVRVRHGDDVSEAEFHAVVSAVGMLNRPVLPEIDGLDTFAGTQFHSSHWPADLDVAGKRVGVIGTGASSVQLVPAIAPSVAHLDVFQRSRHWMMPNPFYLRAMTDGERWCMSNVPYYAGWYRFLEFWNAADRMYPAFRVDPNWESPEISISAPNEKLRILMTNHMRQQLDGDDDLFHRMLPDYPPLGKRILQDGGWYAALRRDNVDLVTEPIARIVPEGVLTTDGATHELDVLVLATGFHARKFLWPMSIRGPQGTLQDRWGEEPRAYLGITVPGFPNLFCLYGPNMNPVVGSVIFMLECQIDYVIRCLALLVDRGDAAMECRQEVHDEYNARVDAEHEQMVWRHPKVHSYYNNDDGRVVTNAPWRLLDYWRMTREPEPEDFRFVRATTREAAR